jgi:hypothetical protein
MEFIERATTGFAEYAASVEEWTLERGELETGVPADVIREAAHTYALLAEREPNPKRRDILTRLAEQESRHAEKWADRIAATTGQRPDRTQVEHGLTLFQRLGDPNVVLRRLEQEENKAEAEYEQLLSRLTDPLDRQIAEEAQHDERSRDCPPTLAGGTLPTRAGRSILHRERWHARNRVDGDDLRRQRRPRAVFGIVSGMAGYQEAANVLAAGPPAQ